MKNIKYILLYVLSFTFVFWSCDSEDDLVEEINNENPLPQEDDPDAGDADFNNYIAVGNSLTSGFADAALYPEGQQFSFPSILASQLQLAGGGEFVYPDVTSGNGFGSVAGDGSILGKSFIDLNTALAAIAGAPDVEISDAIQFTEGEPLSTSSNTGASLNNFGVTGARVVDLAVPGYGSANPFFGAFQSSATASILNDAVSANGSFFTLWIGNSDVLGYGRTGGVAGESFNPSNPNTLTDAGTFTAALSGTLDALSANGAEGVILNVPPLTIIPFFQTVTELSGGINLIPLDEPTAAAVNAAYNDPAEGYNPGLDAAVLLGEITQEEADLRKIEFAAGNNPPVITDESLTEADISAAFALPPGSIVLPKLRQAKVDPATGSTDLFPLTALGEIGSLADPNDPSSVVGVGVPVGDEFTLTLDEQTNVITAYATYNAIIQAQAEARPNIHLVDVGPIFADLFGLSAAQAAGLQLSAAAQAAADGELGIQVGSFDLVPLSLTQEGLFNSVFSTDGIHPNPRGAALIANEVIRKINSTYNASIPEADVLDFPSINVVIQ